MDRIRRPVVPGDYRLDLSLIRDVWIDDGPYKPLFLITLFDFMGWVISLAGNSQLNVITALKNKDRQFMLSKFASTWSLFLCVFVILGAGWRRSDVLSYL